MDSARSWLQKFQPRDKLRASTRKKDDTHGGNEAPTVPMDDATLSNITKQKVAAAKQYIENHYKEQMKNLQERKERSNHLGEEVGRCRCRVCKEKATDHVYAMKKLKKSEMLRRGQIVNWRSHLKFPEEARLTIEAKDLISKLLCNVSRRLGSNGAEEIKVLFIHFLMVLNGKDCIKWKSAFIPEVNDELDTQNFEKFDEMLSSKDLNFVGYTYKNFEIVNDYQVPGMTELRKKSSKVKKPSIKSLFDGDSETSEISDASIQLQAQLKSLMIYLLIRNRNNNSSLY
ncbi:hypothetical protein ACSQ67_024586 [Phaseolus vulgaris]